MPEVSTYTALAASAIDRTSDFLYIRDATGPSSKKASPQSLFDANLQGSHSTLGDFTLGTGTHTVRLNGSVLILEGGEVRVKHAGLSAASEGKPLVNIDGPEGTGEYRALGETGLAVAVFDSAATSYTLSAADQGRTIRFTASTAVSVSVPTTLPDGFFVRLLQFGSGKVTPSATGGAALNGPQGQVATGHQYATIRIDKVAAGQFIASGHVGA